MPQWRKLHTKTIDSLDVNDMPDDFTRLFWVLLPLALDCKGRIMDNPTFIRSKVFPLRQDVNDDMVSAALDWFGRRGMIIRYMVNGRKYLFATNFAQYQGNTSKEAESNYPAPQEEVDNWSRPGLDQVLTRSASDSDADADADTEDLGHRAENDTILPPAAPESPAGDGAIAPAIAVDWPDLGDLAAHDPVPRVKPAQKPVSHETRDFDTPGSRVLKAKLSANAASIGRSGPQRFRTLEQKRRFLESERRLGVVGLTQAITTALGSGVNTLDRIVAWVGKYNNGHGQISPRASPATPEVAAEPVPESGSIWGGKINGVG